jgi:hypothetical protein
VAAPAAAALGLAADTETRAQGMSILAPTAQRAEILPDVDIFPQFRGKIEHLGPERSSVGRLIKQRCKLADFIQQFRGFFRVAEVQDLGATEQIFEIECCDAHGQVTETLAVLLTYPRGHSTSSFVEPAQEFRCRSPSGPPPRVILLLVLLPHFSPCQARRAGRAGIA